MLQACWNSLDLCSARCAWPSTAAAISSSRTCGAQELRPHGVRHRKRSWRRVGVVVAPRRHWTRRPSKPAGSRGREPAPAAATRRRAAHPAASSRTLARPALLGHGATPRDGLAPAPRAGAPGDGAPLAPLLAVALAEAGRTAPADAGSAGPDPPALGGEPAVGHRAHSGRAAQAGDRRRQRLHAALPLVSGAAAAEPDPGPPSYETMPTRSGPPIC
jgi:hypothetical protein